MTSEVIPDRATAYGGRVRRRLTEEMTIWLTTVGRDGTPQPNPAGFLWDRSDSLLTYSQTEARRLANTRRQPLVSLNFDSNDGNDIVVLTGTAEILDDYPAVPDNPAWLEKYSEAIGARFGSAAKFAERLRIVLIIQMLGDLAVLGAGIRILLQAVQRGRQQRPDTGGGAGPAAS